MTKVLQIVNYYYPHIGGIETVAGYISKVLCDGYEQKIICANEVASSEDITDNGNETVHQQIGNVEVVKCASIVKVSSQSLSPTFGRELAKLMKGFKPDIVIFHYPNPFNAFFLKRYLRGKNFKLVVYWHLDITKQKILGKFFIGQTEKLLERADAVVATSPNYIDGSPYLCRYRNKCRVIANCVDTSRLTMTENVQKKALEIRKKYSGKTICFAIGRHVPYKGLTYLVQASRFLSDDFTVLIGGKGPLTESLKAEASGDEKLKFLGKVSDEDLVAYYFACDVFCFPSITKNEAFGIALAEGMFFGKPAVTFTVSGSGINYVNLDGITGVECRNADAEAFASAIRKLASDREFAAKLGSAARKRVLENFTEVQFRERVLGLMKDLGA